MDGGRTHWEDGGAGGHSAGEPGAAGVWGRGSVGAARYGRGRVVGVAGWWAWQGRRDTHDVGVAWWAQQGAGVMKGCGCGMDVIHRPGRDAQGVGMGVGVAWCKQQGVGVAWAWQGWWAWRGRGLWEARLSRARCGRGRAEEPLGFLAGPSFPGGSISAVLCRLLEEAGGAQAHRGERVWGRLGCGESP